MQAERLVANWGPHQVSVYAETDGRRIYVQVTLAGETRAAFGIAANEARKLARQLIFAADGVDVGGLGPPIEGG